MCERLIELMQQAEFAYLDFSKMHSCEKSLTDFTADYLLENGVIVPPCKVGTELHFLWDRTQFGFPVEILSTDDWQICTDIDGTYIDCDDIPIHFNGTSRYVLGKTVFLTKEEAEQALKERNNQ